jgi:hypothetical protein
MVVEPLTFQDISNIILEVVSGKKITKINYCKDPAVFKQPTGQLKLYLNFLEKFKITKYIEQGYFSEQDLLSDDKVQDQFFTLEDQETLEEVQKKIKAYKQILKKKDKSLNTYKIDLQRLKDFQDEEHNLLSKKKTLGYFSAEYKAREDKFLYMMNKCIEDLEGLPISINLDNLDSTIYSMEMFYSDLGQFLDFYFGYDTEVLRQVARNYQWKMYFSGCKNSLISLFNRSVADFSLDQINLISWSNYYSNIDEIPLKDRPSDNVLEDDEKLDEFMAEYSRKLMAEAKVSKISNKKDPDHVIITAESPDYVKYHKSDLYSDPSLITGKSKEGDAIVNNIDRRKKSKIRLNS